MMDFGKRLMMAPVILVGVATLGLAADEGSKPQEKEIKWGGRIQFDGATMNSDDPATDARLPDGTEFRRARLFASGEITEWVSFKIQLDFADSFNRSTTDTGGDTVGTKDSPAFKDVYIRFRDIPGVGAITAGHFKEPFSLEELTSSKYITFMERALPNVFAAGRNNGIMVGNELKEGRMTWAAGVFADTDNDGRSTGGGANYTARITGLPWWKGEDRFVHLGLSLSHRNPDQGTIGYQTRIGAHLSGKLIDSGTIPAEENDLWAGEVAWVNGRFSAQGEYISSTAEEGSLDVDTSGYYAQTSFWVTRGDHRAYKKSSGSFGRVVPENPLLIRKGGTGGLELALRYSFLDFSETTANQEYTNVTLGANWHINKFTRLQFNAGNFESETIGVGTVDADVYQARLQIEF